MNVDVLKIKSLMLYHQLTMSDFASQIGIAEGTLRSRFQNPNKFTQEEMAKISSILHIENPKEIFFR